MITQLTKQEKCEIKIPKSNSGINQKLYLTSERMEVIGKRKKIKGKYNQEKQNAG